jgi:hydrogenase-4 component B
MPSLALLGLVAALFHTLNHATFKSLLFLSAGSVISQTHTRNMEEYGGLIKRMPQTAFLFLIGSMAISALPPFNGFFSEWLTFQGLFIGISSLGASAQWTFVLAAGALAFTGGLALACFVKAFGATFLARPRSEEALHAKESSPSLLIGMGSLAALTLVFGLFSGYAVTFLEKIGKELLAFQNTESSVLVSNGQGISVWNGFSSVSAPAIFFFFVAAFFAAFLLVRFAVNRSQKTKIGCTWDCGTELTPRMEITATGFSRSIILIFKGILKPSIQPEIEYHDSESRYLPKSTKVVLGVGDVYHSYFYQPLRTLISVVSMRAKDIQSGNINMYISYIFIALVLALFSIV